ncbi:MAG: transporter substrate-binding domain-containing protein [Rubrimonas sp.]|uniref:transporter substrate-binding domain-containing protein n=1 Tax=Rubrimonas sp. TaxID=2036015 RepID=UPI002FDCFF68
MPRAPFRPLLVAACLLAAAPAVADQLDICVEGAYPPFSWTNDAGEVEGFDIDIARALCAEMGAECRMVATEWDAILPALEEGKCDAIVASMAITEARRQRVDFSAKYQQTPIRFAAAADAGLEDTPAGLAGKRVCIQRGTIHQDYLEAKFPEAELALYPTQEEAFLDLGVGRCDAAMADALALESGFLDTVQGSGFAMFGRNHLDPALHGEGAGIAVRKTDPDLRDRFSAAIAAIRANGVFAEINDRYFGFDVYGD